jgi:hypothetical protein
MYLKHLRGGKQWTVEEATAALSLVRVCIEQRPSEIAQMGPFIHNSLTALLVREEKVPPLPPAPELVSELVELDQLVRRLLPGNLELPAATTTAAVLKVALRILLGSPAAVDAAQRDSLFGFSVTSELVQGVLATPARTGGEPSIAASSAIFSGREPRRAAPEGSTDSPVTGGKGQVVAKRSRRKDSDSDEELARLERENSDLKGTCVSLSRDCQDCRDALLAARGTIERMVRAAEERLGEQRALEEAVAARDVEIESLHSRLRAATDQVALAREQNEDAKASEFARGREVARAQIREYCNDKLSRVLEESSNIDSDAGRLIAAAARSLLAYLRP